MLGLGVGVGDAADVSQHILGFGLRHGLGIRVMTEQFWGDLIDTLIGTLRTQDNSHQQLEHATKLQFGRHIWHLLTEVSQNFLETFFFSHLVCKSTKYSLNFNFQCSILNKNM